MSNIALVMMGGQSEDRYYLDRDFTQHKIPREGTLEWQIFKRRCQKEFFLYVQYCNPEYVLTHFHLYLCDEAQKFIELETDNTFDILLLSVPPQFGKSKTITETLISWYVGRYAGKDCILASYQGRVAEDLCKPNRDKFRDYASKIFNNVIPNDRMQQAALWETLVADKSSKSGYRPGSIVRAAGLEGGITKYGCTLYIIDDPLKNQAEAESETIINNIKRNMVGSVKSRIRNGGKLIVIQTRWVTDDVIGYIKRYWSEFIYKDINLPAEAGENDPLGRKPGESLIGIHMGDDPAVMPKEQWKDNNWLKQEKLLVVGSDGESYWLALYQGQPTKQSGNMIKRDWLEFYEPEALKERDINYFCLVIDATFEGDDDSDYVAIGGFALDSPPSEVDSWANAYMTMLIRKRMDFSDTLIMIEKLYKRYDKIDNLIIEKKANGAAIVSMLRNRTNVPSITEVTPGQSKTVRASAILPILRQRALHLPTTLNCDKPYFFFDVETDNFVPDNTSNIPVPIQAYIKELTMFPRGENDDMVDMTTMFLSKIFPLLSGEEPLPQRKRYTRYTHWYPDMWADFEKMSESEQLMFIKTYGAPKEWQPTEEYTPMRDYKREVI